MTEKLEKAVDARQLSAHDVVHTLRLQLEQIFEPPLVDQVDLSPTQSIVESSLFMVPRELGNPR